MIQMIFEKAQEINSKLEALGTTPLRAGCKLSDLIARPHLTLQNLSEIIPALKEAINLPENRKEEIAEAAEIQLKYQGYIEREKLIADKMHRLEDIKRLSQSITLYFLFFYKRKFLPRFNIIY